MACLALVEQRLPAPWQVVYGCDYNHAKSRTIRRGHAFGFVLCKWHHIRVPMEGKNFARMRDLRPEPDGRLAKLPRDLRLGR